MKHPLPGDILATTQSNGNALSNKQLYIHFIFKTNKTKQNNNTTDAKREYKCKTTLSQKKN